MPSYTLSRWVDRLLNGAITIECPHMELLGRDHEPPVFTGPGHIKVNSDTRMHFVMHGTPRDGSDAFKRIVQAQKNPYNILHQFRMNAVGYDGNEWSGGWTNLACGEEAGNIWRLSGPISHLHTGVSGLDVAERSGVELIYDRRLRLPIPMNMVRTVHRNDKEVLWSRSAGAKTVKVLDTEIEFFLSAEHEHVWAVADTSASFPHPHLENWISEPFNLLLGEVVAPRLKARNFGDRKASISLCSASGYLAKSLVASILCEDSFSAGERFWSLYSDILTLVATAKNSSGTRNFEAHPLTQYYWEIIQAANGSNWVLCMTLASVIEGIVKMMFTEEDRKTDWAEADVDDLKKMIKRWSGNDDLRSVALNCIVGLRTKGVARMLRSLIDDGLLAREQVDAWQRLRNSSMHGEMAMPWSDQEQDARINNLIELAHRLSEAYIKRELGRDA